MIEFMFDSEFTRPTTRCGRCSTPRPAQRAQKWGPLPEKIFIASVDALVRQLD
jgi:hypothetical protein